MRVKQQPVRKKPKPRRGGCATLRQPLSAIICKRLKVEEYEFVPEISPVEQEQADTLKRYSRVAVFQQVEAETTFTPFYLDIMCRPQPGRTIAIECDGYQYHSDPIRDFCRDALILGTYDLSCIYRVEAWAVRQRPFDWLRILSELEPGLFTDECAEGIRALSLTCGMTGQTFRNSRLFLTRLVQDDPSVQRVFEFAQANTGITFPKLVERVRRSHIVG
jgi:hypothetical protein